MHVLITAGVYTVYSEKLKLLLQTKSCICEASLVQKLGTDTDNMTFQYRLFNYFTTWNMEKKFSQALGPFLLPYCPNHYLDQQLYRSDLTKAQEHWSILAGS